MKRILAGLLAALLLFAAIGCGARGAKGMPLMWKVTDGEGHTLYMFGTIHVGDARSDTALERVSTVMEQCDALAVEFDVVAYQKDPGAMTQSMMQFVLTDGTTIEDHMSADLYERAYALLKEAGLFPDLMKNYNLAMWAQLVETAAIQTHAKLDAEHAMDVMLINRAYEKEIPVWDIESAEFQMDLLNSFDDELYLMQIETTLDSLDMYGASLELMYKLWLAGNRELFWQLVATETDGSDVLSDYNERVVSERNASMAEKAKEYMQSGKTVFFAVGAAHMANDAGIVQLLKDAGYTVEEFSY